MESWLSSALDYIPRWLEFQLRAAEKPGLIVAIAHQGRIVLEHAFGYADLESQEALRPRHRFRVASHSKSFTAAGILKLRESKRLKLDDSVGDFVEKLNPAAARTTIGQILSHSAGLIRDGQDAGQFMDRRPFLNAEELITELKAAPPLEANTRFKYSNLGYGLLGLVIESITGESYGAWIKREVVDAAGLKETLPDMPLGKSVPFARGHTGKLAVGRRLVIPGDFDTQALAPAAGFVSTAADLARYFAQLSPKAKQSILSAASRREMIRRHWRDPYSIAETHYGLGIISGNLNGWDWFGHSGGLQGYISRTVMLPNQDLAISVLSNGIDGWSGLWVDGIIHILQGFATQGAPARKVAGWNGRWWSLWGVVDLVPMGSKVMVAVPGLGNPFMNATELEITGPTKGRVALAGGYGSHGESVRCRRTKSGKMAEFWLSGSKLVPERVIAREMESRYGKAKKGGAKRLSRKARRPRK